MNLTYSKSGKILTVFFLVLIVYSAFLLGQNISSGNFKIAIIAALFLPLLLKKPQYFAIILLISSSTLPVLIYGDPLNISMRGSNFRLEYVVFFIAIMLLLSQFFQRKQINSFPMDAPALAFVMLHIASIGVAFLWGYMVGIGPAIRLLEAYGFYFIASRFTCRNHIPQLALWLTIIAVAVSVIIIITTLTGSQYLFSHLFSESPDKVDTVIGYACFFTGHETPRIWIAADFFLPIAMAISVAMILRKARHSWWYFLVMFTLLFRAFSSAQRFVIVFQVGAIILTFLLLMQGGRITSKFLTRWFICIGICVLAIYYLAIISPAFNEKIVWLGIRSQLSIKQLKSYGQYGGILYAWSQISQNPLSLLTGFSYFRPWKLDINLGPLLAVYKYGVPGLFVLLWFLWKGFRQSWLLLKSKELSPVEQGLACAIIFTILAQFFGSFIRGMAFLENAVSVGAFSIVLGWIQVVWADVAKNNKSKRGVDFE